MTTSRKWTNIRKIVERSGPFSHPDFEPSPEILDFLMNTCRILVVGAGGLGCELLKNLALMGFQQLHVIDMDTIELSNLNRQFLFRPSDIGKSKAEVAANFINRRITGCNIQAHFCRLENFDIQFYRQFHIIVCGLDSIQARRWINAMLMANLTYNDDGTVNHQSIIPIVDGGTEGFKGNVRVILPGINACFECTIDLYPPQTNYPLCTIANTPRLPEHCIEYVKVIQWPKENPFDTDLDSDDPNHINWIFEKAVEYANQYQITGITYRLVQGVVKNIIPAVASTNAVIAALCCTEVFKIATSCFTPLDNYIVFNDVDGIYTYAYQAEKKDDCLVCCRNVVRVIEVQNSKSTKLRDLIDMLKDRRDFQMQSPGLTVSIGGQNRTLYMSNIAMIEEKTRPNLNKTLSELQLDDGVEIMVVDVSIPNPVTVKLKFLND